MSNSELCFPKPKRKRREKSNLRQQWRELVLQKDGHRCTNRLCPSKAEEETPRIDPHHIVFRSQGGEDTLENGVALCAVCHDRVHNGYRDPSRGRVRGRVYMIEIIEQHKDTADFRWSGVLGDLKAKEGIHRE